MIESKRISAVVAVVISLALVFSVLAMLFGGASGEGGTQGQQAQYVTKIFGEDIITIDIIAQESEWQSMLENASSESFIMADIVVNGKKVQNIGIRPKGNSSLTQVAQSGSDRYSFRLQFDEYVKGQNCFGLESMVVNNMMGDYTYMKEYVSYALMREAGVDAPCFGFAKITVNGEDWGLYLAVELYNESYEQRVFGDTSGMLYNVKSMDMGGGGGERSAESFSGFASGATNSPGETDASSDSASTSGKGRSMGGFGGFGSGNGGTLQYTDDASSSYSAIFDNVVGKGSEDDYQRVIAALKSLGEGRDLEQYFDVDQILRYLAAHTVVVNLDSYSSSMAQNYYIYENNGQVTVLPWDYNLAWGGFQSGTASSVVNFPIDTPVSGVEMSARPLLEKLFANEEYLSRYHGYLQQIVDNYFANGQFELNIRALDALIGSYVQNDPTAFCTYEQYQAAVEAFITLGNLRAQSVQGQLDGTVPSTTQAQEDSPDLLIAADAVSISALGSMGGGMGGFGGGRTQGGESAESPNENGQNGTMPEGGESPQGEMPQNGPQGEMPDRQLMMQAMEILQQAGGNLTEEVKEQLLALGLTEEQIEMLSNMQNGFGGGMNGDTGAAPGGFGQENDSRGGQMPSGGESPSGGQATPDGQDASSGGQSGFPGTQGESSGEQSVFGGGMQVSGAAMASALGGTVSGAGILGIAVVFAVSLLLMIAATVFLAKYKRRY